jgi:hypothetical protein
MAYQLARIVYRMLKFGQPYHDQGVAHYEAKHRQRQLFWLTKQAAALNLQLIPMAGVTH